ncbi:probable Vacuolar membrane-associated protein IML1 [Pseudozyma flocculosa]|uniref:Vacuolar membrane-associated protein IML1 n=1 Tax=Pseudozyma flocculosa TaxID=84751 RepID=A0A5C3F5V3_9BASI|nr:probable Vacuolar membrane-associated protein IML1 [Pseudozyma flocculosa]
MTSNFAPSGRVNSLSVDRFSNASDRRRSSSSRPQRPLINERPVILWTHEPPNFSTKEVVLSPDYSLPHLSEGDLLRLTLPAKAPTSTSKNGPPPATPGHARGHRKGLKPSFVFRPVHALADPDFAAKQSQLQISISKNLASIYGFHNRAEAVLTRVSKEENTIDHVELYFRDQYVGRADMWRFLQNLEDTCVYCGQKIVLAGSVRATIGRIFIKEKKVTSGYVAASTKAIFRSESAKYNLFIQLAREMWEFDEDGEIYYEKALQGFIPELLKRWRSVQTNHVLSITLFARVHYDESELHMLEGPIRIDGQGRWYIDYYKVVVDLETNCDWSAILTSLKEEPVSGPAASQEELHADLIRDRVHLAGRLSYSYEGNLLEAINLTLNPFDEHYIDRDLNRTGLSIVFLTAGTGHFEVDKRLLRITTERMIENGIGLDLVCLTKMPLHSVPLFHFKSHYPDQREAGPPDPRQQNNSWSKRRGPPGAGPGGSRTLTHRHSSQRLGTAAPSSSAPPDPLYFDAKRPDEDEEDFYSMPHWVDCSFYNLQQDKPFRADRFVPRCKMYEVQMMGIMENQISDIAIPYLDLRAAPKASSVQSSFYLPRHVGPPGSAFVSEPAASGFSDLALVGLTPKEQRRIARERFDRDVFADVEPSVKSLVKPATASIESPVNSDFQRPFDRPELKRTNSSGYGKQSVSASSTSPNKQGHPKLSALRTSRLGRESSIASSGHDSMPPSPTKTRFGLPPTGESPEEAKYALPTRPLSQVMAQSTSRPASIRSTSTFPRGLRLLEPIGKAKALVAPTDAVLSATSHPLNEEEEAEEASEHLSAATAASRPGSRTVSLSKATSPTRRGKGYGSAASWLWNSLTGGGAGTKADHASASGSSEADVQGQDLNSTPATRRIQEVLASQLRSNLDRERSPSKRSVNSPGILSRTSSLLSVHEAAHIAPIKIPAQVAIRSRQEAEAEERIFRDQDAYEQQLEEEEAKQRFAQRAQVEKQTLVNPSNPSKNLKSNTSQLLRWQHLFPRRLNHHVVKWRSMTTPACLPLTTLYLPTEADLLAGWTEHPHTTSVSSETVSFLLKKSTSTHPALAVLREMAFHRLAQGYQFIVPASKNVRAASSRKLNDPKHFSLRWPSELLQPGNLSAGNPIFLSMTNQIHRISYDRQAGAINVKRYVRRTEYNTDPMQYECCVWPRNLPGYQTVKAKFSYPDSASYNWTYLDSLIAGYVDERFVDSLRYWRTRFVLVPTEGSPPPMKAPTGEDLDDEEIRLLGTDKLAELFHRARYVRSREERDATMAPRFLPTSLDPALSLRDDEFMKQLLAADEAAQHRTAQPYSAASSKKRHKNALAGRSLELVAKDMRTNGLVINDRLWHRMTYADIFTGADFVTWMCQEYSDVHSREDAVEWGMQLMDGGLFEHVNKTHGFLDGHYFYRLASEYGGIRSAKSWFRGSRSNHGDDVSPSRGGSFGEKDAPRRSIAMGGPGPQGRRQPSGGSSDSGHPPTLGGHSRQPSVSHPHPTLSMTKRKRRVQLSRSLIIDVDPGRRSERAEVAFLHHDVAHNPDNGFNFQIHWLGTTARFIEDIVQNWTRTVERYGLRLIEAPIGQIKDVTQHNPFQAPVQIELSLPPPHPSTYAHRLPPNTIAEQYFEYALLRRFGFILDQEASDRYPKDVDIVYSSRPSHFEYSQFVHRSGVGFVQVLGGKAGFLWLNNRLFTSHLSINPRQSGKGKEGGPAQSQLHHLHHQHQHQNQQQAPDPDKVRREFTEFCADPLALERFYRQVLAQLFEVEREAAEQQRIREERFRAEVQRELELLEQKQQEANEQQQQPAPGHTPESSG